MINRVTNYSYECSSSIYCPPISDKLFPGLYQFEVWGASGGLYVDNSESSRGKGGYSYGTIKIRKTTNIYVFIGGSGENNTENSNDSFGGNNGGGNATSKTISHLAGGGGGTDIRIESLDLHARVIVAGGGGGCEYANSNPTYGGAGGGTEGQEGHDNQYPKEGQGGGGKINEAGTHIGSGKKPDFGIGGCSQNLYSGAGGGGWYGGGAGSNGYNLDGQGGGGSGYVFSLTTKQYYPDPILSDDYLMLAGATIQGTASFPNPYGGEETGHTGNGFARITKLCMIQCTGKTQNIIIKIYILICIITLIK